MIRPTETSQTIPLSLQMINVTCIIIGHLKDFFQFKYDSRNPSIFKTYFTLVLCGEQTKPGHLAVNNTYRLWEFCGWS